MVKPYKIYIANQWIHPKNKIGFEQIIDYAISLGHWERTSDPNNADIVWAPSEPESFPNAKRILYGPHFSVLPDHKYFSLPKSDSRLIYIQPSQWVINMWNDCGANGIPMYPVPFPVDLEKFKPQQKRRNSNRVFIYIKNRHYRDGEIVNILLKDHGYDPVIIDYHKGYNQDEYIKLLNESSFGIWIDGSESQGFALEEALAMDVPLLVWSVTRLDQIPGCEQLYHNIHTKVESAPYWDDRCGVLITDIYQLQSALEKLKLGIEQRIFKPREFVKEKLSIKAIYEKYWKPICQIGY